MKTKTTYTCEGCGLTDADPRVVEACEAIPMTVPDLEIGDLVTSTGGGYGWWKGDETWFHRWTEDELAARGGHGHHGGIGNPIFVVIDLKPYAEVGGSGYGAYAHKLVPIVYSPSHANRGDSRVAYGWSSGTWAKRGKVSKAELAKYQAAAQKLGSPEYFSY